MTSATSIGRPRRAGLTVRVAEGYGDELLALGLDAGLDAAGVTEAVAWPDARARLEARKAAGLHAGMRFTYGDPGRATDPTRSLPDARTLLVGARAYRRQPSAFSRAATALRAARSGSVCSTHA